MNDIKHLVYLHGSLGDNYTREPITIYARDIHDVVRGLTCNLGKKFLTEIRSGSWHVSVGKRETESDEPVEGDKFITEAAKGVVISQEEIHIYPKMEGALVTIGTLISGIGTATGSATLVGAGASLSTFATSATLGSFVANVAVTIAASAALSAVVSAINTPKMEYDKAEVDRNPSFLYNGVVNVVEQGGPVPLVYGLHMAGSTVISAYMQSEELIGYTKNLIPPVDSNVWLDPSDNWTEVGATLESLAGDLVITKTAAIGSFGGVELAFSLADNTTYRASIRVPLDFDQVIYGIPYSDDIILDVYDGTTQLGYTKVRLVSVDTETSITANPSFLFTTLATQVTPRLRIYSDIDNPPGTVRYLELIKIEEVYA